MQQSVKRRNFTSDILTQAGLFVKPKTFTFEKIFSVYSDGDTVPDNVYKTAVARGINQDIIWKLLNLLERKVAKRRHLI